jgi:hypothetical protein
MLKPVQVIVEPKETPLPDRDDIIRAVRARETGIGYRYAGLGDRQILAVDPGAAGVESRIRLTHHTRGAPRHGHSSHRCAPIDLTGDGELLVAA